MWAEESSQYWKERDNSSSKKKIIGIGVAVLIFVLCFLYFAFSGNSSSTHIQKIDAEQILQMKEVARQKSLTNCNSYCFVVGDTQCNTVCKEFEWAAPKPQLHNLCISGCKSNRLKSCKEGCVINDQKVCMDSTIASCHTSCSVHKSQLPRPTSYQSCIQGCTGIAAVACEDGSNSFKSEQAKLL